MNRADDAPKSSTGEAASAPAASSGRTSASSASDTAVVVLQQERAKLEARLADAEKQKEATARGEGNPYDPPAENDPESLRQMIAQVKSAITARQNAVARVHRDDSARPVPKRRRRPPPRPHRALRRSAPSGSGSCKRCSRRSAISLPNARFRHRRLSCRRRLFPSSPSNPTGRFSRSLGLTSGLWMGVLWAFARVALGHDQAVASPAPTPAPPVVAAKALPPAAMVVAERHPRRSPPTCP